MKCNICSINQETGTRLTTIGVYQVCDMCLEKKVELIKELQDKLSRRNMQIRELKRQIEALEINTVYQNKL